MILQLSPTVDGAVTLLARLAGLAIFAGLLAAAVALCYRWYVRERVPSGLALLVGLAGVAVVLNTTPLLAAEIAADDEAVEIVDALFNIVAFVGSAAAAVLGVRLGDRLGTDLAAAGGSGDVDADVSDIVQTVGRVTSVQLPDDIADIVGYDPVSESTKESLAGRRFLFPRRLTTDELRGRLTTRLKTDYGVGSVDVEFGGDGTVEFLAVGSRAAGIGPTLPPATNAVAIRADPAHAAGAGDLVQVWDTDPMQRVLTGELRGVADDVVTIAIDAADTPKLDPTARYKLVTLPVQERPDREFASLLRAADETLATITVEAGSDLEGVALEALDVTVAAITREDDRPEPLPAGDRTLQAGDVVYVIATPEILRQVEGAAEGSDGAVPSNDSRPTDSAEASPPKSPESGGQPPEPTDGAVESTRDDSARADSEDERAEAADGEDSTGAGSEGDTESDSDGDDGDLPSGDAFPETDDLPGMDSDLDTPSLSSEPSGDASDETAEGNLDPTIDAAIDETFDGDGEDLLAELDGDGTTDDSETVSEAEDESQSGPAEEPDQDDEQFDGVGRDDEQGDDVRPDDEQGDGEAEDEGTTADEDPEDAVPFTPHDVGDADSLADPLTEPDADESGAPVEEGSADTNEESTENTNTESSETTDQSDAERGD